MAHLQFPEHKAGAGLGMTPEVVSALQLPGGGLWIREPWRVLAFGFLYFTATGISELCDHRWIRSRDLPPLELSKRSG